jgi:NAD(P)-dependent dehydrogenase (short-subunit alcohol dehydrogenase family)
MSRRAQENPEILERMKQKQPLAQGLMEPEDIARAALFLLSPESSMITGQVLGIDAGWSLR